MTVYAIPVVRLLLVRVSLLRCPRQGRWVSDQCGTVDRGGQLPLPPE